MNEADTRSLLPPPRQPKRLPPLLGQEGSFLPVLTYTAINHSVVKLGEVKNMLDHYDLTGQLDTQMPKLKQYKKGKKGYIYYGE